MQTKVRKGNVQILLFFCLFMSLQAPSLGSNAQFTKSTAYLKARFKAMPSQAVVYVLRMPYTYMRLQDEGNPTAEPTFWVGQTALKPACRLGISQDPSAHSHSNTVCRNSQGHRFMLLQRQKHRQRAVCQGSGRGRQLLVCHAQRLYCCTQTIAHSLPLYK